MADPTGNIPFFIITAAIGAVAGAIIGGVVAAKNGGNVWAGMGFGAAAGGLVGLGAGAAAGALLAGSVTASTAAVVSGAGMLGTAVSTGGVGAGVTYAINNLCTATTNFTSDVGALFSTSVSNAGTPFVQGQHPGDVQIGVDPNTLISNGRTILPEKFNACVAKCEALNGIYGYIEVYSNGVIYDGHHRVEYAKMIGAAVDVIVRQGRP